MLEPGEEALECAAREFHEETGLVLRDAELASIVAEYDSDTDDAWVMFVFRAASGGVLASDLREGIPAWVRVRDLERLPKPAADGAILATALGRGLWMVRVATRSGVLESLDARRIQLRRGAGQA
jgi:8-oxo-dGTP pyrophosphatase MutT (NUDIX family)